MRLLHRSESGAISLTKDLSNDQIPPYAILSHVWMHPDEQEVTYQDFLQGIEQTKPGYQKIVFCGEQAARNGLAYFWVDTCCIDKSNNTELQEAIISMFVWYQRASRCYVHLFDVSAEEHSRQWNWEQRFRGSKWFTRGWTLQELLAPPTVEFFSNQGTALGDKKSLEILLHDITKISIRALRGTSLSQFPIEERIAWTHYRHTSKAEDEAYCLIGLFGLSMSVRYGEGRANAMARLKEKISKVSKVVSQQNEPEQMIPNMKTPNQEVLKERLPDRKMLDHKMPDHKMPDQGTAAQRIAIRRIPSDKSLKYVALHSENFQQRKYVHQYRGLLRGTKGEIWCVAFSPTGEWLAAASTDGTVQLLDVITGDTLQDLRCSDSIWCIAISSQGQRLAAALQNGEVWLWDLSTYKLRNTLKGHISIVTSVAFSTGGEFLASASHDKTVCLWDGMSGKMLHRFGRHRDVVYAVAFSSDATRLASASYDHTVQLWEVGTGELLNLRSNVNLPRTQLEPDMCKALEGHGFPVYSVAFSPDGKTLASGSSKGVVRFWDAVTGEPQTAYKVSSTAINCLTFSPDSNWLAVATSCRVLLLDVRTGDVLRTVEGDKRHVSSIALSPSGSLLACASYDDKVHLWDLLQNSES